MTVIETLLAGLFDYAGLYPPAGLSMRSAANYYLAYLRGEDALALGNFIVNFDRVDELRQIAGDAFQNIKLSVICSEDSDLQVIAAKIRAGLPIRSIEIKCSDPSKIERIGREIPAGLPTYFEVPTNTSHRTCLAIRNAGARAKIRTGGITPDAFPAANDLVAILKAFADLRLPFKATAGLHHPLRSKQPLTYQTQCPTSVMHGFVNLAAAAASLYFGGDVSNAQLILTEEDSTAWQFSVESLRWRDYSWNVNQLATIRNHFFSSIGTCSFEEPIRDLKSLGWL